MAFQDNDLEKEDMKYQELIENTANYNTRLRIERKLRLPFLDSQTGVAQSHSMLYMPLHYRRPGIKPGQLYSYPAKPWRKRTRSFLFNSNESKLTKVDESQCGEPDMHQIRAVENPMTTALLTELDGKVGLEGAGTKDRWYDELLALNESADLDEPEDRYSDSSDYDPSSRKRKKKTTKKGGGAGRGGKKNVSTPAVDRLNDDIDKPYHCNTCDMKYKTRPGLSYHMTHAHKKKKPEPDLDEEVEDPYTPQTSPSQPPSDGKRNSGRYCDFCLGDELENKKTGHKEELVSCADCGRSGHPSCLQFTPNMIISVKQYHWQCIECKSCGLCGTSDNDVHKLTK